MTWGEVFQLVSAFGALGAAFASWCAAAATRNAAVGQLVNDLIKEYKTVEFRDALRRLRRRTSSSDQWVEEWWNALAQGDKEAKDDEDARYTINACFSRVADLKRAGLLSPSASRILMRQRGIAIWYRVVEPMTKKLDPDIPDSPFEALRQEWRRYGYKRPMAMPGGRPAEQAAPTAGAPPRS